MSDKTLTVLDKVIEQITQFGNANAAQRVVNLMVEKEVAKRSDALIKVIDHLAKQEADLKKIKPQRALNVDGSVASETYDQQTLDRKNKLEKTIATIIATVNGALEGSDFDAVYKLAAQCGGDKGGDKQAG